MHPGINSLLLKHQGGSLLGDRCCHLAPGRSAGALGVHHMPRALLQDQDLSPGPVGTARKAETEAVPHSSKASVPTWFSRHHCRSTHRVVFLERLTVVQELGASLNKDNAVPKSEVGMEQKGRQCSDYRGWGTVTVAGPLKSQTNATIPEK